MIIVFYKNTFNYIYRSIKGTLAAFNGWHLHVWYTRLTTTKINIHILSLSSFSENRLAHSRWNQPSTSLLILIFSLSSISYADNRFYFQVLNRWLQKVSKLNLRLMRDRDRIEMWNWMINCNIQVSVAKKTLYVNLIKLYEDNFLNTNRSLFDEHDLLNNCTLLCVLYMCLC
jgi:hypothetical protein